MTDHGRAVVTPSSTHIPSLTGLSPHPFLSSSRFFLRLFELIIQHSQSALSFPGLGALNRVPSVTAALVLQLWSLGVKPKLVSCLLRGPVAGVKQFLQELPVLVFRKNTVRMYALLEVYWNSSEYCAEWKNPCSLFSRPRGRLSWPKCPCCCSLVMCWGRTRKGFCSDIFFHTCPQSTYERVAV